ncbi:DUF6985 domain-containing protein [Botrimarina mediterranea]
MAFAEATGRPAKFCRAAILEAKGDETEAMRLIQDEAFVRLHTDFDFDAMFKLAANPAAIMEYTTRQEMTHAGKSEAEIAQATAELKQELAECTEREAAFKKRERQRVKKVLGKIVDDPVFGRLAHDGYSWSGTINLPPFGEGIELIVEPPEPTEELVYPTRRQREVFARFRAQAETRYRQAERAHFESFREVRPQLVNEQEHMVSLVSNWTVDPVPDPQEPADIWAQIEGEPTLIVGPDIGGNPVAITLAYEVAWDPEHGNYLRFESGCVVQIGGP